MHKYTVHGAQHSAHGAQHSARTVHNKQSWRGGGGGAPTVPRLATAVPLGPAGSPRAPALGGYYTFIQRVCWRSRLWAGHEASAPRRPGPVTGCAYFDVVCGCGKGEGTVRTGTVGQLITSTYWDCGTAHSMHWNCETAHITYWDVANLTLHTGTVTAHSAHWNCGTRYVQCEHLHCWDCGKTT